MLNRFEAFKRRNLLLNVFRELAKLVAIECVFIKCKGEFM